MTVAGPSWVPSFIQNQMDDLTKEASKGNIYQMTDDDQFICMGCNNPSSGARKKVQVMPVEKRDEKESHWKHEGYVCNEDCFNFFLLKVS